MTIDDFTKTDRGFHELQITESNANALLRNHKSDIIGSSKINVQKGDFVVFSVEDDTFHDISDMVWEVSFVSYIPHSELGDGFGLVSLSLKLVPYYRFQRGDINSDYLSDTLVLQETEEK